MRQGRGRPRKGRDARLVPPLRELGISKQLSSDCQQLAAIPEAECERRLAAAAAMKDPRKLTMAAMLGKPPRRRVTLPCPHCAGTGRLTVPGTARRE
jgi:hypothetical protein